MKRKKRMFKDPESAKTLGEITLLVNVHFINCCNKI